MTSPIYLDVYFFMNLGMNVVILWLENKVFDLSAKRFRMVLSSIMGAAWSCCGLFLPGYLSKGYGWITICLLAPIMILVAFGRCSGRLFLKKIAGFYLITVLLAGVMEAILGILPVSGGHNQIYALGGWIFLIAGTAGIAHGLLKLLSEWKRKQTYLYQVNLHYRGQEMQVTALLDTGNRLREPYGSQAVHVITYEACSRICKSADRVLYIPFTSIGKGDGLLPAIRMDEMELYQNGICVKTVKEPIIAVIRRPLSPEGEYEMLLNEELKGEK